MRPGGPTPTTSPPGGRSGSRAEPGKRSGRATPCTRSPCVGASAIRSRPLPIASPIATASSLVRRYGGRCGGRAGISLLVGSHDCPLGRRDVVSLALRPRVPPDRSRWGKPLTRARHASAPATRRCRGTVGRLGAGAVPRAPRNPGAPAPASDCPARAAAPGGGADVHREGGRAGERGLARRCRFAYVGGTPAGAGRPSPHMCRAASSR